MTQTICELQWLQFMFTDFGLQIFSLVLLYCDNKATLYIAANPVSHERTKHIKLDFHFIREKNSG